jgi:hypothetical protein
LKGTKATILVIVRNHVIAIQLLKGVRPYGHAYVIPMDFPMWQKMVIALTAFMPATAPGELSARHQVQRNTFPARLL